MQGGTSGVRAGSMAGLMGRRNNQIFGPAIAVLAVLYAGIFIAWPDKWFADDTYFYLQVAWNFARGLGSTFNGIMPTNGYHPLWMLLCALVYTIVPSKTGGVHGIAVLVSLLDGLMFWTVRRLLKQVARLPHWRCRPVHSRRMRQVARRWSRERRQQPPALCIGGRDQYRQQPKHRAKQRQRDAAPQADQG